ncbi:MAG: methyl-accepting chemotaxis protein [Treponema sp.]|nr:methyl-accepting chemotaxis protein [Treponema sp.]
MPGKSLKISTKLVISAAAFLLPLGIMLFLIISSSVAEIQKNRLELNGLNVLRPAVSLMQVIPLYVSYAADGKSGNIEFSRMHTSDLINELIEKYHIYFGAENYSVQPQLLYETWNHFSGSSLRETILWGSTQFTGILHDIIIDISDISGLANSREIQSTYIVKAAVHELPQAQERIISISNMLRTVEDGAFTQRRRDELELSLMLLTHSDNARIQNIFNTASAYKKRNAIEVDSFESQLKSCYDSFTHFSDAVNYVLDTGNININDVSVLNDIAAHAIDSSYRLQIVSLDILENIITQRIDSYMQRTFFSLLATAISIILSVIIIIITINSIHKSTIAMGNIFKQLHENNLTVKVKDMSGDELGKFMSALDNFLEKLNSAFCSFNSNASLVSGAVYELSSSAKEITATANEQSASVAEIVSTMENNKNLSTQAAEKTAEVASLASQTQELSQRGAYLRDINEEMMMDIQNQNAKIIEVIKNLAEMLSRIDESVQLIDTIADHTKLIAFNAALEASSSGEAGSRFAVVAGEIRRFADNVVESVTEIKEKICELQDASQTLITEADNGSLAINTGYKNMIEQKEVFKNIVDTSQNVAIRTQQITNLSRQQELASAQVFTALKEISLGVNQFVSATAMTSAAVDKLNNMSVELKETLAKYQTVKEENI